jgi:hypothetical protein
MCNMEEAPLQRECPGQSKRHKHHCSTHRVLGMCIAHILAGAENVFCIWMTHLCNVNVLASPKETWIIVALSQHCHCSHVTTSSCQHVVISSRQNHRNVPICHRQLQDETYIHAYIHKYIHTTVLGPGDYKLLSRDHIIVSACRHFITSNMSCLHAHTHSHTYTHIVVYTIVAHISYGM